MPVSPNALLFLDGRGAPDLFRGGAGDDLALPFLDKWVPVGNFQISSS